MLSSKVPLSRLPSVVLGRENSFTPTAVHPHAHFRCGFNFLSVSESLFPPGNTLAVVASANKKYRNIKIVNKPTLFALFFQYIL